MRLGSDEFAPFTFCFLCDILVNMKFPEEVSRLYRFIFVDDEEYMRTFFPPLLDWSLYGFELAGVFSNGRDALTYLQNHPVDIVISDIKMGQYSGIDLCRDICALDSQIGVVLLSGYQDFEDARQAIRYGVLEYVAKPVSFSVLSQLFTNLKQRLDARRMETNVAEYTPLLLQQLLFDISAGLLQDEDAIQAKLKMLDLPLDLMQNPAQIVRLSFSFPLAMQRENKMKELDNFNVEASNVLRKIDEDIFCHVYHFDSSRIQAVLISMKHAMPKGVCDVHVKQVKEALLSRFRMELMIHCEPAAEGFLQYCRLHGTDQFASMEMLISQFVQGMRSKDTSKCSAILDRVFSSDQLEYAHSFIAGCLDVLEKTDEDRLLSTLPQTDFSRIDQLSALRKEWTQFVNAYQAAFSDEGHAYYNSLAALAQSYIKENYHKDIHLEDVSSYVAMNPAYFSRFFKQHTGENFIDYLTRMRIEKAKELLRIPQIKVYEVGRKTGYRSVQHFYRVFKQYAGCTPTQYRNMKPE